MLIDFTKLWQRLPPAEYNGWIKTDWDNRREILHLLCGALWHLELASHIKKGDFSEENMSVVLNPENSQLAPWEHWTSHFPVPPKVSVQPEGQMLTMSYTFNTPLPPHMPVLFQTLLLADGALRLAGAYELVPTSMLTSLGDDSFRDILKDDGALKDGLDISNPRVCLLLVIAFRDSFMHGENSPDKKQPRFMFRRKWFAGDFASSNLKIPYSPAIIARACHRVWEEIIALMT